MTEKLLEVATAFPKMCHHRGPRRWHIISCQDTPSLVFLGPLLTHFGNHVGCQLAQKWVLAAKEERTCVLQVDPLLCTYVVSESFIDSWKLQVAPVRYHGQFSWYLVLFSAAQLGSWPGSVLLMSCWFCDLGWEHVWQSLSQCDPLGTWCHLRALRATIFHQLSCTSCT